MIHTVLFLILSGLLLSTTAAASQVSFQLTQHPAHITLTNRGSLPAYYPQLQWLNADRQWQPLTPAPPAMLAPGHSVDFQLAHRTSPSELAHLMPALVLYYDASGAGQAQPALFNAPALSLHTLDIEHTASHTMIHPPQQPASRIQASWLFWAAPAGEIPPLFTREHLQPQVRYLDWHDTASALMLPASARAITLIHQTDDGLRLQPVIPTLPVPPWWQQNERLYQIGLILILASLLSARLSWQRRTRHSPQHHA